MGGPAKRPGGGGRGGRTGSSSSGTTRGGAAARQPPHLAAICAWEGWNDAYRESARHGGMICSFRKNWQDMQVKTVQHGYAKGAKSAVTGEPVCCPEVLGEEDLVINREHMCSDFTSRE